MPSTWQAASRTAKVAKRRLKFVNSFWPQNSRSGETRRGLARDEDSTFSMSTTLKIAVLAGDGIGPEVMAEAIKTLYRSAELHAFQVEVTECLVGGAAIDAKGRALPEETL